MEQNSFEKMLKEAFYAQYTFNVQSSLFSTELKGRDIDAIFMLSRKSLDCEQTL